MVDYQALFNAALAIILLGLGWAMRTIHETIKDLRKRDDEIYEKVNVLSVSIPENYVHRQRFDKFEDRLFTMLRNIEDKIDDKADK